MHIITVDIQFQIAYKLCPIINEHGAEFLFFPLRYLFKKRSLAVSSTKYVYIMSATVHKLFSASPTVILLKSTEDLKELWFMCDLMSPFTVLEIKTKKF